MKFVRRFDRYIMLIFIIIIIAVVATSYFTFKQVIDKYNKNQRQAIIPLFSIINSEIIRPLDIAYFMANDNLIIDYIQQPQVSDQVIFNYLNGLSKVYNMVTFIALEQHGFLLDSTNKKLSLDSKELEWYERLKVLQENQFADIGNAEDPHLYFDMKMFNSNQDFLGFIGVAIDLNHFSEIFNQYKKRFGFELILVDQHDYVTLSSNNLMKTESHHRADELTNIDEFAWYEFIKQDQATVSNAESVQSIEHNGRIITQLPLKELNWRIFLISPPALQQNEYWQLFAKRIGLFIIILGFLYFLFQTVIHYYKRSVMQNSEIDYLTKLPNRSYLHWQFNKQASHYQSLSIVLADIDNFKKINDTYGHIVGDEVIKIIAEKLQKNLRKNDICCRWGGEEFVLLLPNTSEQFAIEISERIRQSIADTTFDVSSTNHSFNSTVSFGIYTSSANEMKLEQLIIKADKALYSAKNNGRNRVEVFNG